MTLRAVGRGEAAGALRFVAPEGISVEPATVELAPPLAEGATRTVTLRIKARAGLARRPVRGPLRARRRHAGGGGDPAGLGRRGAQEGPPRAAAGPVGRAGAGVHDEGGRVQRRGHLPAGPGRPPPVRPLRHREFHLRLRGRPAGRRMALPRAAGQPAGLEFAGLAHVPRRRAAPVRVPRGPGRDPLPEPVARSRSRPCGWGTSTRSGAPVHDGTQEAPHKPVVADWLYFPHPTYRRGVLLRFSRKIPVTLHLPPLHPPGRRAGGRRVPGAVGGRGVPQLHHARGTTPMKAAVCRLVTVRETREEAAAGRKQPRRSTRRRLPSGDRCDETCDASGSWRLSESLAVSRPESRLRTRQLPAPIRPRESGGGSRRSRTETIPTSITTGARSMNCAG